VVGSVTERGELVMDRGALNAEVEDPRDLHSMVGALGEEIARDDPQRSLLNAQLGHEFLRSGPITVELAHVWCPSQRSLTYPPPADFPPPPRRASDDHA